MPLIDDKPLNEFVNPVGDITPPEPPKSSFFDVMQAAGRTENDIVAGIDLMTQPVWKPSSTFNLVEEAKKRNVEAQDFTDALNPDHLDFLVKKRDQEVKDNSTLDEAGWLGFGARVAAGLVSPTTLIPIIGAEGAGLKIVAAVAGNALLSAGIQEGVLAANQRTRTPGQIGFSLAASTVLGGVLGAVSHSVSKSVIDKIAHDMVHSPEKFTISSPPPGVLDVGAKESEHLQDAGSLKKGWGANLLSPLSPITRGFEQWNAPAYLREIGGSQQLRKMTAGFSQGSLTLDKNRDFFAASPGGNVEDLKRTYAAVSYAGSKILEENYSKYILGTEVGGFFKKQRAIMAGAQRPDGKLTWPEFKRQIALDMWSNFSREGVPDMVRKAAKEIDEKVYKKLYDEGVQVGIFTGKEKTVGDENYANRVYNNEVIMRRHNEFVKILADHYRESLDRDFNEKLLKLNEAMQKNKQLFEDANLPFDKARQLRDDLLNEQVDVQDATNPAVLKGVETLRQNNKLTKELTLELDNLKKVKLEGNDLEGFKARQDRIGEIEAALKAKALENEGVRKSFGSELERYQLAAKEIRRRLNNLNQNVHVQDVKMRKKLDKIAANEDAQSETIIRAQKQLQKFVKMLDSASPEKLDAELTKLKNTFAKHAEEFDKAEKQLHELEQGTSDKLGISNNDGLPPELIVGDKMDAISGKMDEVAGKIEQLDAHDPVAFKQEIESMMRELADTHAKINAKRVLRNERLWKQIEHLSPEARAKRMTDLQLKMKDRPSRFIARWNTKNAGDLRFNSDTGLLEGKGNFEQYALDRAKETVDKIRGTDRRLVFSDIVKEKRGPELARVLNIPSEKIKDFLETDIEKMLAIYTRTVGSDISIARVFGSPDAAEDFAKLSDERHNMLARIETMTDKEGKPLDQKAKEELQYKTNKFYDQATKDLHVLLERAKSMRGIPKDPASWSARGAKMAMDINFMRLMGNVVVSSVADPARLVMKYGLTRTFRDGFVPMITAFKQIRMSQKEAMLAGAGLDPVLHSRAYSLMDIFDDAHRGTPVEKGVHWMSTKMGLIAGFDHWTSAMKQLTAGVANAKLLDNISAVMEGKVKGKELTKAQEFLAKNNIDADLAERIWKEVTNGEGGGKVNGVWLPNTENWTDEGARRAYRAALGGEIDATIITPGFERPNWVDSSIPARMVAQFKSFGLTSTQKTLMAGLQEHDLAFFNGVMSSLALGALSYYLYAMFAGGKTEAEMRNAGLDKWADEAISRAGITGVFDEAQRIANRIPLLQNYASFSGRQTTRRGGGDLTSEVLGPSFDLMQKAFKVGTEIDDPTKSTLHTVRTLLPLQNVFYLRQLLDRVEEAAGSGLPKRRTQ